MTAETSRGWRSCSGPAVGGVICPGACRFEDSVVELFEVLVGTGLRKGEALGLHGSDVDWEGRVLFVRHTLSDINNTIVWTDIARVACGPCRVLSQTGWGLSVTPSAPLKH